MDADIAVGYDRADHEYDDGGDEDRKDEPRLAFHEASPPADLRRSPS